MLASLLGMTAKNLSRAFASLADQAGVVTSGREVRITNREALTDIAKPSPLIDRLPGVA